MPNNAPEPTPDPYLQATQRILAYQFGLDESEITLEKSFEDFGADSLDDIELVMTFEEEYDIDIPDDDAEKIRTVAAIVAYLQDKKPEPR